MVDDADEKLLARLFSRGDFPKDTIRSETVGI